MKNVLICNNCHSENAFYAYNCKKCNAFLRTKVANIDLWETIEKLIDTPVKAAEKIIHSENKNYVITLLVFICIKFSLILMIVHNSMYNISGEAISFISSLWKGGIPSVLLLIFLSTLITVLNKISGIQNRVKDNIAIYTYAFIPLVAGFFILIPIQFALFGEYWFTFNPSPVVMKPTPSIILFIIEGLIICWSGLLLVTSTYSQTKNKLYSFLIGLFMIILFSSLIFIMSQ